HRTADREERDVVDLTGRRAEASNTDTPGHVHRGHDPVPRLDPPFESAAGVVRLVALARVIAEAEEALRRVLLEDAVGAQEGLALQQAPVVVLALVGLVLGRRLAERDRVPPQRRRVAEETDRRE